jgi:ribulose-5-phosphate 4-epimerase/fuculose-1-phosphate aldolase
MAGAMEHLIEKYLGKLESQGLAHRDKVVFLALDAELFSNRPIRDEVPDLTGLFGLMNINTVLLSEPSEPYKSIISEIIRYDVDSVKQGRIIPPDCETRTFLHDIPVVDKFSLEAIAEALSRRKSVLLRDRGIVTYGAVTPEQAFVSFSSTCFATFIKYFHDSLLYLENCESRRTIPEDMFVEGFNRITGLLSDVAAFGEKGEVPGSPGGMLMAGPAMNGEDVIAMLAEAGRAVVAHRLVDSYFGNISYVRDNTIYISQTGSSLDELEQCIDAVPLDGSSSVGITASSELTAHKRIYRETGDNAILHGHPKFSVIMSMHCLKKGCDRNTCHKYCKESRSVAGIPVVSGEVGTGPTGLLHTVPKAMREGKGAIVYGHGVFTSGKEDFRRPFRMLRQIEERCRKEYFSLMERCQDICRA